MGKIPAIGEKLLDEYSTAQTEESLLYGSDCFVKGFRLGVLMIMEVITDENLDILEHHPKDPLESIPVVGGNPLSVQGDLTRPGLIEAKQELEERGLPRTVPARFCQYRTNKFSKN